jgi:hypothetical protein
MTCRLNGRRSIKRNSKSLVSSLILQHAAVTNPFEMNSSTMTSLDETFLSPSMFDVSFDLFQSFFPMESFPWMDEFQSIPMEFFPSVDELQSFRRLDDTATFDAPLSASIRNSFDPEEGLPIDQLDGNLDTEPSAVCSVSDASENGITADTSHGIPSSPAQLQLSPSTQDQASPVEEETTAPDKGSPPSREAFPDRRDTTSIVSQILALLKAEMSTTELHLCLICKLSFVKAKELVDHQNLRHPNVTCEICGRNFAKIESRKVHRAKSHRGLQERTARITKRARGR